VIVNYQPSKEKIKAKAENTIESITTKEKEGLTAGNSHTALKAAFG